MLKHVLKLLFLVVCMAMETAAGDKNEPILVGYGRDPKWSPGETTISLIRNDTLYVTGFNSGQGPRAIHAGPIFKYEWLDDSTIASQERTYLRTEDVEFKVEKILRVSVNGKVTQVANDSCRMSTREGRGISLIRFSDGLVGYSERVQGQEKIVKLSPLRSTDTSSGAMHSSLFVRCEPSPWGKVWLYYGSKENGRQITKTANTYSLPRLAPTADKFTCNNHRGEVIVYDTLDNELANLGRADMEFWDPSGQYVAYCRCEYSEFDIERSDIFIAKYDGSEIRQLTRTPDIIEFEPSFSPSGRYLMYSNERTAAIYLVTVR